MENQVENELVAKAVCGDRNAFSCLVESNYMLVYRTAYKYTGHKEDAEDITQEVFVKLGRAIHSYKGEASFKTWLYKITANSAKDYFRKNKNKNSKETPFSEGFDAESNDQNQEDILFSKQILQALNLLPEKLKEAIILVYSEGLNHAEAGAILGCSEGTVSWRVHEARKKLLKIKDQIKLAIIAWILITLVAR
jgi:RNA polymerase sigma-70 factor (ECF subfamily)